MYALPMLTLLLALLPSVHAQEVFIELDPQLMRELGLDSARLEYDLDGALDEKLHVEEIQSFLGEMASANTQSTKGMGVDYGSNPQRFVVGFSLGTAINGDGAHFGKGTEDIPEGGFAFQSSATLGMNLGAFSSSEAWLRRFVVYLNAMDMTTHNGSIDADLVNYGVHLQSKIVLPSTGRYLHWGGVDFTTGWDYSEYVMTLVEPLEVKADPLTWDATGTLVLTSQARSVPLEVSSNIRFTVLTGYAGLAVDINQGAEAVADMDLSGPVKVSIDKQTVTLGSAGVTMQVDGGGAVTLPRAFLGLQVNLLPVKVYGHLNLAYDGSNGTFGFGGHTGVRLAL
jgi:hypothetical protein